MAKSKLEPMQYTDTLQVAITERQLIELFIGTCADSENDENYRQNAKWFAEKFPEFDKDWKWYWTAYLEKQYGN